MLHCRLCCSGNTLQFGLSYLRFFEFMLLSREVMQLIYIYSIPKNLSNVLPSLSTQWCEEEYRCSYTESVFGRFCFSVKMYALFHPHFYECISALSRLFIKFINIFIKVFIKILKFRV